MENTFFQKFLETGLFDIGDQDERLEHLEKSISDLQKILEKNLLKLPKYTLVALDSDISDKEPVLKEVEDVVTEYWKTLRIKHKEMPRQILRGVILNALHELGKRDAKIARIIYLTGSNYFPYAKLGKEKEIVESLLSELAELAEENAVKEWSFIEEEPSLKLSALKLKEFKFASVNLNETKLKAAMLKSVQNSPSNHGPQHGGASTWGEHFATTSTTGISTAFQTAMELFNESLSPDSIENPINKFFAVFKKSLDENLKASFSSMVAVERRSKLLWWKETLYSQSQKKSYRELDKKLLPVIMSTDLYNQLPEITPVSVDFLLKDTFYLLLEKEGEEYINFENYLKSIKDDKPSLLAYLDNIKESEGRISLTDFIGLFINDKVTIKDFQNKTGLDLKGKITFSALAVSILHDLMAQYLISK
jgi:hypothetical protein